MKSVQAKLVQVEDEGFIFERSREDEGEDKDGGEAEEAERDKLEWRLIESVEVFKRDLWGYDLICLRMNCGQGLAVEIDEEDPLWEGFVSGLPKHIPGCVSWGEWFPEIMLPAFEESLRVIFERKSSVTGEEPG